MYVLYVDDLCLVEAVSDKSMVPVITEVDSISSAVRTSLKWLQ
jgi:hypothetical protein